MVTNLPCEECLSALLAAPAICAECLGFTCPPGACARPWLAVRGEDGRLRFDSVSAVYLSIGPGARVLKSWKTTPNPSLARHLGRAVALGLARFAIGTPLFLIPVPQSARRRWELAGGSVLRLCGMIRAARRNPDDRILDLLEIGSPRSPDGERGAQALSRGGGRYSRRSPIRARAIESFGETTLLPGDLDAKPALVLVDDFLTSGATLRAAAAAAREGLATLGAFGGGNARLEVFVLGFRPALFRYGAE